MACYNPMLAAPYLYSKTLGCKLNLFLSKSQNFSLSGITKPLKENRLYRSLVGTWCRKANKEALDGFPADPSIGFLATDDPRKLSP